MIAQGHRQVLGLGIDHVDTQVSQDLCGAFAKTDGAFGRSGVIHQ